MHPFYAGFACFSVFSIDNCPKETKYIIPSLFYPLVLVVLYKFVGFVLSYRVSRSETMKPLIGSLLAIIIILCNDLCLGLIKYEDYKIRNQFYLMFNFRSLNFCLGRFPFLHLSRQFALILNAFHPRISLILKLITGAIFYTNMILIIILFMHMANDNIDFPDFQVLIDILVISLFIVTSSFVFLFSKMRDFFHTKDLYRIRTIIFVVSVFLLSANTLFKGDEQLTKFFYCDPVNNTKYVSISAIAEEILGTCSNILLLFLLTQATEAQSEDADNTDILNESLTGEMEYR